MTMRYFEIRAPRPDFTGKIGAVAFADGVARVSFDDAREERRITVDGTPQTVHVSVIDEHRVQVGRSAVLFAQRRPGYTVVETDEAGRPLDDQTTGEQPDKQPARATAGKGASK